MDHTTVVRDKMTEKYLLDELDAELRNEFEEHYFDCPECALDVRAAAEFVEQTKSVLGEASEPASLRLVPARNRERREWLAWLRPAFAAPALALLLLVVGYQNLVTYPRVRLEAARPQVLPAISVNVGTWGAGGPATAVSEGKGLLIFVRIPPDSNYVRYTAEVYDPAGKPQGSFEITPVAGQDQWPVTIPAIHREAGTYTVAMRGFAASGQSKELGNASFELEMQK